MLYENSDTFIIKLGELRLEEASLLNRSTSLLFPDAKMNLSGFCEPQMSFNLNVKVYQREVITGMYVLL